MLSIIGSLAGLMLAQELLALMSLSVLVWLLLEWFLFQGRVAVAGSQFSCRRTVNGSDGVQGTLWTARRLRIETTVRLDSLITLPHVICREALPENLHVIDGHAAAIAGIGRVRPLTLAYDAIVPGPGRVEFRGIAVRLSDRFGLFVADRFVPARQSFRVLPVTVTTEPGQPVTKRMNTQMPPGIHRLQRPGGGCELLEIRDYVPGDPPKSIAWKVSARRGSLMTREYESEVPVRTTLYVDASYRARSGSFGFRPIDQLLTCAGSIARSALSVRDPVGLVTFSETGVRRISSGQGNRHFFGLLDALAESAGTANPPPGVYSTELLDLAWQISTERFPELIDRRVNPPRRHFWPPGPSRRRELNRRTRLAGVLAALYDLPFAMIIRLERDELLLSQWLQQFLTDQGCAWTWPVIERRSRELHDWDGKFDTLTDELSRAILHGRDNELFVLLIDLVDYTGPLVRLEKVIRLARARHHRVSIICSWPNAAPLHSAPADDQNRSPADEAILDRLLQTEQIRIQTAAERLRRELCRCGAAVSFATDLSSIQRTLAQADLARFGRVTHVRSGR